MARAIIENRSAPLHSDFARDFLFRRFHPDVVAALYERLPRYSRGPRKGLVKGVLHWKKCTRGGWVNTGFYYDSHQGHVQRPGSFSLKVELGEKTLLDENANATDEGRIKAIHKALPA